MRAPAAALSALFLLLAPTAAQAATQSGLEGLGRPVGDERLADMRGRFISPDNISYFGIQMQTSWMGPDGVTTEAALVFSVDFAQGAGVPEGATPTLTIGYTRSGDPAMDVPGLPPGYVAIAVPAGLGSVQGAVQSQQIAGDGNAVRNGMSIAVVPASLISEGGNGLTEVTGGQAVQFADGDALQFIAADNRLGLELTGAGEGVSQAFDGGVGHAAQHVLLGSSNNTIANDMNIVIGFDSLQQTGRANVQNALSAMKGLGF